MARTRTVRTQAKDDGDAATGTVTDGRPAKRLRTDAASADVDPSPTELAAKDQKRGATQEAQTDGAVDLRGKLYTPASPQRSFRIIAPPPSRDPTTREFSFSECPETALFKPNLSPEEMLRAGAFGGSYFRPIRSKRLGKSFSGDWQELPPAWIQGLDVSKYLTNPEYDETVNRWGARVGQSIEEWEANGWIVHEADVRGWFQWYCRFFMGRRCDDDERQIMRWKGVAAPTGRWRTIFLNKYVKTGVQEIDLSEEPFSPGIRQTLLHWAFDVTTAHLSMHADKMAGKITVDPNAGARRSKGKKKAKGKGKGWAEESDGEKVWNTDEEGVPEGEEEKVDDHGPKEPELD